MTEQPPAPTAPRPRLIRVPLVPVAAALSVGVAAGRFAPLAVGFWALVGLTGLGAAIVCFRRAHLEALAHAGMLAAILAIGAVHAHLAWYSVPPDHVVTYTGDSPSLATVRGRIVTCPVTYTDPPDPTRGYQRPARTGFLVQAEAIQTHSGFADVTGLLRVTVKQPARHLHPGQQVELIGWIGRYRPPDNPGQFDLALARRKDHTWAWMSVPAAEGAKPLGREKAASYSRVFWNLRAKSRQHLMVYGDRPGWILNALISGQRHPGLSQLNQAMMRAGIAHFLSISGLHLGIFLGFAYLLCRLLMLTPVRSAGAVLVLLVGYVLIAEPRPALLRSGVMAGAICLSVIFGRGSNPLNALAAAAVVLLVIDPLRLFQAGFQLSFAIVAGIILLHRPIRDVLFARWRRRRGLMVFRGEHRLRRWFAFRAGDWLMSLVSVSVTAFLVAVPLVAHHFGIFSPYAPLLSLLLLPLLAAVLVPGYLAVGLAWALPNLSYWIGSAAAVAAGWLAGAVELLEHLPLLTVDLRPVGPLWVATCYAAVALIALRRRLPLGRVFATTGVLLVVGATFYTQRPARGGDRARLHLLAVGAGQCAVLETPDGETYVFDAGSQSGVDIYSTIIKPFFRRRRLPPPQAVFLSHANTDHYNGVPGMIADGWARRVYLNDYFGRQNHPSEAADVLLLQLQRSQARLTCVRAGEVVELGPRTRAEVLWPPVQIREGLSVNDTSLVLRITCDDQSVLLTGDLDATGQRELTEDGSSLSCDALVLPHHGGWEETLPRFVRKVDPSVVLVSRAGVLAAPASGGSEAAEFYGELRQGCRFASTGRDGWVCVHFGRGKTFVETMR